MDHFKEEVVLPRNNLLGNILYVLCWAGIVFFGLYGMLMLQMLMFAPGLATILLTLLTIGAAVLLFFFKDFFFGLSLRRSTSFCYFTCCINRNV